MLSHMRHPFRVSIEGDLAFCRGKSVLSHADAAAELPIVGDDLAILDPVMRHDEWIPERDPIVVDIAH